MGRNQGSQAPITMAKTMSQEQFGEYGVAVGAGHWVALTLLLCSTCSGDRPPPHPSPRRPPSKEHFDHESVP